MRTHVKTVALLQLGHGAVLAVIALGSIVFFSALSSYVGAHEQGSTDSMVPVGPMIAAVGKMFAMVAGVLAVPRIVIGWGLWRLRPWARTAGLVVATLGLIDFPVGTATGGYAYWVLLQAETKALFEGRKEPPPLPFDYGVDPDA